MHHIFPVSNSTWTDREYFSFSSFCFYYYSLNKISLHMGHNLLLQNLCSCNRCQSISVNLLCVLLTIFHSIDYFVDYERENFHQYLDHLNRFFFLLLSKWSISSWKCCHPVNQCRIDFIGLEKFFLIYNWGMVIVVMVNI